MFAREIPDYPGYYADEQGNIYSGRRGDLRLKQPTVSHKGYERVGIVVGGKQHNLSVHVLVARAFLGERPNGLEVCHNDGNSLNNRPENLRYDSRSANAKDRFKHGKYKLTEQDHQDIRWMRGIGVKQAEVSEMYGVSKRQVTLITRGR